MSWVNGSSLEPPKEQRLARIKRVQAKRLTQQRLRERLRMEIVLVELAGVLDDE